MKTAETKSASHQQANTAAKSFFNQEQEQAFFSETSSDRSSFFPSTTPNPIQFKSTVGETPFFSPSPATVQAKCATCAAEEQSQLGAESSTEPPRIQRTPAFESEAAVQAKATPNAKAIAPPPANPKSQLDSDTKELEQQEDALADTPQIQMMPAFSSSDDTGDGDDTNAEQPPVQFSLAIGHPRDSYEREADQVAAQVINMPEPQSKPAIQRQTEGDESEIQPKTLASTITPLLQQKVAPTQVQLKEQNGSSDASPNLESRLNSSKGSGNPLSDEVRSFMEPRFGADFSQVRVHTDSAAAEMNEDLKAQAFTHGSDIYFGDGKAPSNNDLTAHELTHTVQQGAVKGSVQEKTSVIQRADDTSSEPTTFESETGKGKVERTGNIFKLTIEKISLPDFKVAFTGDIELPTGERENKQIEDWEGQFKGSSSIDKKIEDKTKTAPRPINKDTNTKIYAFKLKHSREDNYLIGDKEQIKERAIRPHWDFKGMPRAFHVDHKHEFQLGGKDRDLSNLWLLEASLNIKAGEKINAEKYKRIQDLIDEAHSKGGFWQKSKPDAKKIRYSARYLFKFKNKEPGLKGVGKYDETKSYDKKDIEDGKPLEGVTPLTSNEIQKLGLNSDDLILLFAKRSGGRLYKLKYSNRSAGARDIDLGMGVNVRAKRLNIKFGDKGEIIEGSEIEAEVFRNKSIRRFLKNKSGGKERYIFPVKPISGLLNAGYIDSTQLKSQFNKELEFQSLSPIDFQNVELDDINGVSARGKILPSIPIISDTKIDLVITGDDIYLEKVFSIKEFKVPSPFKIDDSSLAIRVGSQGLEFVGGVDFSIEKLGTGSITAFINTRKEFGIKGEFNFDSKKFNPALINIEYSKKEGFKLNGKIGIKEGAIPGVKDAILEANYAQNTLSLAGLAHLSVPGIDTINLAAQFDDKGNFAFTADVDLKAMKGIKSGNVKVIIASKKGEEDIKMRVEGKASPDFPSVPNLNADLSVLYDNGIFKVETIVNYKKGRFDGTINVGITNQPVDDKGNPQGEPNQKGEVVVFGFGQLTVDIFKGNKGTIRVRLTPDKEVLIAGEIVLQNLSPFGQGVYYDKEILAFPELEIPLIGIPGMSVSAFIKGGVHFKFDWQPLMLKMLKVEFKETNINDLESVQLNITGSVGSIATAEVYMAINAGLRARVLIASLSGSLGGEAGLAVTAEAGGDIQATWNMEKGLQLQEIMAHLDVTPRAVFRLTGDVSVDLDLWLTTVNLYYHKWVFAEQAIDMSGLTLKAQFPIRFDEKGDLIRPELDNISLEKPNFTGAQGKDVLNKAINSDAEKELAAKKEEIRATVKRDLRDTSDQAVTPTQYTKKMKEKYSKSPELQEFVIKAIEDESRLIEYEEFEKRKEVIRQSNISLENKFKILSLFKLFNHYVTDTDIEAFKAELIKIEEDKKLKIEQDKQAAEQAKQD